MEFIFGLLGAVALAIGGISLLSGITGGREVETYAGFAMIGSGLGLLGFATVIKLLREIRDGVTATTATRPSLREGDE